MYHLPKHCCRQHSLVAVGSLTRVMRPGTQQWSQSSRCWLCLQNPWTSIQSSNCGTSWKEKSMKISDAADGRLWIRRSVVQSPATPVCMRKCPWARYWAPNCLWWLCWLCMNDSLKKTLCTDVLCNKRQVVVWVYVFIVDGCASSVLFHLSRNHRFAKLRIGIPLAS